MEKPESYQIKICRHCHSIYKKLDQKFCGNNCQYEHPFFIDGIANKNIEAREVLLSSNEEKIIIWMCMGCNREFTTDQINVNGKDFICECGLNNQVYPFTSKKCANDKCKNEDGSLHSLPLNAKACEICGKINFILNENKKVSELKYFSKKKMKGPESFEFKPQQRTEVESKDLPSITFTILNNNLEYILFGKNKSISLNDIIKDGNGFIPDSIYERMLDKYSETQELFNILYDVDLHEFSLKSVLDLEVVELNTRYQPKDLPKYWNSGDFHKLPENKLLELQSNFFKIHIWVY